MFMHIEIILSKPELVGGRGHSGSSVRDREPEAGGCRAAVLGGQVGRGAVVWVWVPVPLTNYFLECGLFPRSPSISVTVCGVSWLSTWRRIRWLDD